jgi:Family of unknown function (DUF6682)
MAVTLTTALTNIRSLLDEPNPQFWSNAELTQWINEGCFDAARKVEWKRTTATVAIVAGTQTYTAPTDIYRVYRMEFVPTASQNTYTVEFRGYMEMDQIWGINQQWPASYPLYYTLWKVPPAMNIVLYPVPSQAGTLTVYYYQQVTPVVSGTDNLDCLQGYEDVIYDFAVYRALRKDSDPRWQEFKNTYEEKINIMYDNTRTFQDQAGTFTTGQSALPEGLVSDGLY